MADGQHPDGQEQETTSEGETSREDDDGREGMKEKRTVADKQELWVARRAGRVTHALMVAAISRAGRPCERRTR